MKTNIGHAEAVSTLSQLTKVTLQLQHKTLVPSLMLTAPNQNIVLDATTLRLQSELSEWDTGTQPRRALINSFGAAGTNVSLVVEEYIPERVTEQSEQEISAAQVFVLSAKAPDALRRSAAALRQFVETHATVQLRDVAFTLQRREEMPCRLALVAQTHTELLEGLQAHLSEKARKPAAGSSPARWVVEDLRERPAILAMIEGTAGEALCQALLAEGNLEKLAMLWTHSAPEMSLDVLIEVRTTLADRCLWITWMHDGSSLRQATLQRFADDLARRLDLWARTCTSH